MKAFSFELLWPRFRDNCRMQKIILWIHFFCIKRIYRQPSDNCFCMRAAQTCAVCIHHRVFGIPTKHLVVRRPDLSWIVRNRLHSSAALVDASRGTPMRRLASTAKPIWAISLSCGGTDSDEATIFGDGSWLTTSIKSQWLQCDAGKCCGWIGCRTAHRDLWLESGARDPYSTLLISHSFVKHPIKLSELFLP